MTLGEVMQAASAFATVQAAFSWLVDNYPASPIGPPRRAALPPCWCPWIAWSTRTALRRPGALCVEPAEDGMLRLRNLSVTLTMAARW